MEVLANIPVDLNLEELLGRLRVESDSADADDLAALAERVQEIAHPKAIVDMCYVGSRTNNTVQFGGVQFASRVLAVNLKNAHRVFPYIATCGRELDEVPGVAGDPIKEYWLDEMRIIALGAASAAVREHIERKYRPGKMSSMSPGSLEDWPITQQQQLFAVFGDVEEKIGVRLTDSFLMVPIKSLSGLCFPTEVSFASCQLCPREGCPGRRAPYDEHLWQERYAEGT
jgi:hypothetical protein